MIQVKYRAVIIVHNLLVQELHQKNWKHQEAQKKLQQKQQQEAMQMMPL
jgi:hypothetical protein